MAKNSIKSPATDSRVPQTREQAVAAIATIGNWQRERQRLRADMDDRITAIRAEYDQKINVLNDQITAEAKGVGIWAEANRDDLTNHGKVKTANLMTGEIRWRMRPPSVTVRALDNVLQALRDMRLTRFIRTREELNKEAILAEPEAVQHIKGISISQREDFVIVPFETALEEVA